MYRRTRKLFSFQNAGALNCECFCVAEQSGDSYILLWFHLDWNHKTSYEPPTPPHANDDAVRFCQDLHRHITRNRAPIVGGAAVETVFQSPYPQEKPVVRIPKESPYSQNPEILHTPSVFSLDVFLNKHICAVHARSGVTVCIQ